MAAFNFTIKQDIFQINEHSSTPKYLQLTNCILKAIESGKFRLHDSLPSINELSLELDISRDTAVKSYQHLKSLGIISSVQGKGYFIKKTELQPVLRIFLLFNKLSAQKKIIYDSFVKALGANVMIDFYVYNNDFTLFKKFITNSKQEEYTHYVIIPHFLEGAEKALEIIDAIPKDKLVLLDKNLIGIKGEYGAAFENFYKDIYGALEQVKTRLAKYQTLNLIFPKDSYYPFDIVKGFTNFCHDHDLSYRVLNNITNEPITEGNVYINLMEDDLILLIDRIISLSLEVGKQVGIISYNETPLKKFILNGLTTISTDFQQMGEMAANLVLNKSKQHQEVPFYLTLRNSL